MKFELDNLCMIINFPGKTKLKNQWKQKSKSWGNLGYLLNKKKKKERENERSLKCCNESGEGIINIDGSIFKTEQHFSHSRAFSSPRTCTITTHKKLPYLFSRLSVPHFFLFISFQKLNVRIYFNSKQNTFRNIMKLKTHNW